ncbi:hypothetical protein V8E53_002706 [Lactarius tabidus]
MDELKLSYFVEGLDEISGIITISKSNPVLWLRDLIHKGIGPTLYQAWELTLLKVDIELASVTRHFRAPDDSTVLGIYKQVGDIWFDQPDRDHFHVCVRLPATRSKHSLSEQTDLHSVFKRSKIATIPPSSIATSQCYQDLQQNTRERILDDRPGPDLGIPPISLLYPGFGHFLDILDGHDNVPGLNDVNMAELQMAVDVLVAKMAEFFDEEKTRIVIGLEYLNEIFRARRGTEIPHILASDIGYVTSDGHNIAMNGTSSIMVKFKNSHTGIASLPQVEVAGYVAHLNAQLRKEAFLRSRVPFLGLTIVGCDITFYALITVNTQIRLVHLTPTYSCIRSACEGRDRRSLYRAFAAASVLQAHILDDAQRLLADPTAPIIPADDRRFPAISKLSAYRSTSDHDLPFEIIDVFNDRAFRLLFLAKTWRSGVEELIILKFTQRYAVELHDLCAKEGHAPSILGYERLPGGWFAVAMEYVKDSVSITHSDLRTRHRDRWTEELMRLVRTFHAENFVHGDLRDANILCKDATVMLVDFDWGGKVGEATYPTLDLIPELLEGRTSDGLKITKDDDLRVLRKTLDKLSAA